MPDNTSSASRVPASRPPRVCLLVISTSDPDPVASSGRTCASSAALSRTSAVDRLRSSARYSSARSSSRLGMRSSVTPSVRSTLCMTSPGDTGRASIPRRFTNRQPSGNRSANWYARCTATVVLPAPGGPCTTTTSVCLPAVAAAANNRSSSSRPVRSGTSGGNAHGAAATWCRIRPAFAVSNNARSSGPSRPSTTASASTVRRCGPFARPRSMSLIARTLTPDPAASSSCVRAERTRWVRSRSPNVVDTFRTLARDLPVLSGEP